MGMLPSGRHPIPLTGSLETKNPLCPRPLHSAAYLDLVHKALLSQQETRPFAHDAPYVVLQGSMSATWPSS